MTPTQLIDDAPQTPPNRARWVRLGLLLLVLASLFWLGRSMGLGDRLDVDELRDFFVAAGFFGALLYTVIFAAANLLQLPGMVFVTAGVVAFGHPLGGVIALVASVIAVSFTFLIFRRVGGRPLSTVRRPFVRRMLERVERTPIRSIVVLRALFQTSPVLNATLALSGVRFRDYLLGSIAGMVLPVGVVTVLVQLAA